MIRAAILTLAALGLSCSTDSPAPTRDDAGTEAALYTPAVSYGAPVGADPVEGWPDTGKEVWHTPRPIHDPHPPAQPERQ